MNVKALITVPNPPAGTAPNFPPANLAATVLEAATALTSQSPEALSAALAVNVTQAPAITVANNVAVPMVVVAPPPPLPPSSPSGSALDDLLSDLGSIQTAISLQTVIIMVVAVVAGVCALAIAFYFCWVRRGYKSRVHSTMAPCEPHSVINAARNDRSDGPANTELMNFTNVTNVTNVTQVISICQMLPVTGAQQTGRGDEALDIGGDAAHSPGGMSWERGSLETGATAHTEGRKGSALQHEPAAGYHVRTAWT